MINWDYRRDYLFNPNDLLTFRHLPEFCFLFFKIRHGFILEKNIFRDLHKLLFSSSSFQSTIFMFSLQLKRLLKFQSLFFSTTSLANSRKTQAFQSFFFPYSMKLIYSYCLFSEYFSRLTYLINPIVL